MQRKLNHISNGNSSRESISNCLDSFYILEENFIGKLIGESIYIGIQDHKNRHKGLKIRGVIVSRNAIDKDLIVL